MRGAYSLNHVFTALAAWERHKKQYLDALEKAHAPTPSAEMLENYKRCFVEAYLEALADANESENPEG